MTIEHSEDFGVSINDTKEIILVGMVMLSFLWTKFYHSILEHFLVFVLEMVEDTFVTISAMKNLFAIVKQHFVFKFFLTSTEIIKPWSYQDIVFLDIISDTKLLII